MSRPIPYATATGINPLPPDSTTSITRLVAVTNCASVSTTHTRVVPAAQAGSPELSTVCTPVKSVVVLLSSSSSSTRFRAVDDGPRRGAAAAGATGDAGAPGREGFSGHPLACSAACRQAVVGVSRRRMTQGVRRCDSTRTGTSSATPSRSPSACFRSARRCRSFPTLLGLNSGSSSSKENNPVSATIDRPILVLKVSLPKRC